MGNSKHHGLAHGGMGKQDFLDLSRGDLLSAAVDNLLETPIDEQISVRVQVAPVPPTKPAVRKFGSVCGPKALMARGGVRPPDGYPASGPGGKAAAGVVHHGPLGACRHTDRARLTGARRQRIAGDLM